MNAQNIAMVFIITFTALPCCRKKNDRIEKPNTVRQANGSKLEELKDDSFSKKSELSENISNSSRSRENIDSYTNLERELLEIGKKTGWPRNQEQELQYRESLAQLLNRRKDLLFSIQISENTEKTRNSAWGYLKFKQQLAIFTAEQHDFAKKLLNDYSSAPKIEQLVIWELVRIRMDSSMVSGGKKGLSGTADIFLRREMAKLLFSALGIQKQELFDAVDLKTRYANSENGAKADSAEEEIERLHTEQSKVAEQILEKHWKLPP